jgi:nitroreductase
MLEAIRERRSVRRYKPDDVRDEDLQTIAEAALSAPSANNQRPWHLVFVRDAATRTALSKVHPWAGFCAQSPVVVVVCGDENASQHWWIDDCSAATENAMVQAAALGLGTCWVGIRGSDERGYEREAYVRQVLGIPSHIRILCAFSLGYPADEGSNRSPGPMGNVHRERW